MPFRVVDLGTGCMCNDPIIMPPHAGGAAGTMEKDKVTPSLAPQHVLEVHEIQDGYAAKWREKAMLICQCQQ